MVRLLPVSIPPWFDFASDARHSLPVEASAFQSHLGSILPVYFSPRIHSVGVFQSHLGSILPEPRPIERTPSAQFQSHLGSILPHPATPASGHSPWFQSHLGSILPAASLRSAAPPCRVSIPPWFDFALVSLGPSRCWNSCFNPTLVRFCPCSPGLDGVVHPVSIPPWFDFAGSWKAGGDFDLASFNPTLVRFCQPEITSHAFTLVRFNPTLVRFCRSGCKFHNSRAQVSIPPWFDFAEADASSTTAGHRFQSHLGSILPRKLAQ